MSEENASSEVSEEKTKTEKEKPPRERRPLTKQALFLPENFKTFIVDSSKAFDHIVKTFRQDVQDYRIISVDTETTVRKSRDEPFKPVDLLQIGTLGGRVFLFRLKLIQKSEMNYIRNILADPNITKVGSFFQNDVRRLANDWSIYVSNWIDVQNVALNCLDRRDLGKNRGLKSLTAVLTEIELEVFDHEAYGDWSIEELSDGQITYAAKNVMAILDCFCSVYANKCRLPSVTTEEIKAHVTWAKFCSSAFFTAFA